LDDSKKKLTEYQTILNEKETQLSIKTEELESFSLKEKELTESHSQVNSQMSNQNEKLKSEIKQNQELIEKLKLEIDQLTKKNKSLELEIAHLVEKSEQNQNEQVNKLQLELEALLKSVEDEAKKEKQNIENLKKKI